MPRAPKLPQLDGPILVLGATSLVGRFVMPRLAEAGLDAVAVSRAPPPGAAGWLRGDLTNPESFAPPPVHTVLSLAPIWLLPPVLPVLIGAGMRRLAAFSSTSRFTKADSPDAAEREVARLLADAELRTVAVCNGSGAAWTILRPTMIYAEGRDHNVSRLARLIARFKVLPLSGGAAGLRQPVHAADLAEGLLAAAAAPETFGKAYDLPGGETLTYRAMAERLFEAQRLTPRILTLPPPLWRLALKLASPVLPGATAAMGGRMAEDLAFDAGPASRDFGWSPRPFRPKF